jgi:hypothetical protein
MRHGFGIVEENAANQDFLHAGMWQDFEGWIAKFSRIIRVFVLNRCQNCDKCWAKPAHFLPQLQADDGNQTAIVRLTQMGGAAVGEEPFSISIGAMTCPFGPTDARLV